MYFCKDLINITLAKGSVYVEMKKYGGIHLKRLIFPRRMRILSFLIYSYLPSSPTPHSSTLLLKCFNSMFLNNPKSTND